MTKPQKSTFYSVKSMQDHIRYVVENYHEDFKNDCQNLIQEFQKLSMTDRCPHLHKAKDLFNYLSQKLIFHLVMEENVVFTMILNNQSSERLKSIIASMESEHSEDTLILKEIVETLKQSDSKSSSMLIKSVEEFQLQHLEHTRYEEEYIFNKI